MRVDMVDGAKASGRVPVTTDPVLDPYRACSGTWHIDPVVGVLEQLAVTGSGRSTGRGVAGWSL